MGSEDDEARRLRDRSSDEDRKSQDEQWHPQRGKELADQSDETWKEARRKGDDGE